MGSLGNTLIQGDLNVTGDITCHTFTEGIKSGFNINGGGSITYNNSGELKWTSRLIVVSNGRGNNFSTSGFFDMHCPDAGVSITGVGGSAGVTTTATGIPLAAYNALYYILPIGSVSTSLPGNFRIVHYTSNVNIPDNWVLIAVRNGDDDRLKFCTGSTLKPGDTLDVTQSSVGSGWNIVSTAISYTSKSFDMVLVNSASSVNITLPAKGCVQVLDALKNSTTYPITVKDNLGTDLYIIDVNGGSAIFTYNTGTSSWIVQELITGFGVQTVADAKRYSIIFG